MFGETVSSMTGMKQSPIPTKKETGVYASGQYQSGIVTIVDIQGVHQGGLSEVTVILEDNFFCSLCYSSSSVYRSYSDGVGQSKLYKLDFLFN